MTLSEVLQRQADERLAVILKIRAWIDERLVKSKESLARAAYPAEEAIMDARIDELEAIKQVIDSGGSNG